MSEVEVDIKKIETEAEIKRIETEAEVEIKRIDLFACGKITFDQYIQLKNLK